jgi:hypothetical protein
MKIYVDSNGVCFINNDVVTAGVFEADFSDDNTKVTIRNGVSGKAYNDGNILITDLEKENGDNYASKADFITSCKAFFLG